MFGSEKNTDSNVVDKSKRKSIATIAKFGVAACAAVKAPYVFAKNTTTLVLQFSLPPLRLLSTLNLPISAKRLPLPLQKELLIYINSPRLNP